MATGGVGIAAAATAGLVLGAAAGWLAARGRAAAPPPSTPGYVNPLADAKKDETLVLVRSGDGTREIFRVIEASPETLLVSVETAPVGEAARTRQLRVARTFVGPFVVLEGDMDPASAAAAVTDFVLERIDPDTRFVESLGRPVRCWKFSGRHRLHGTMTWWVTEELPVHGVVRIETPRGKFDLGGFGWGPGR